MTIRDTLAVMPRAVSVRLDDETLRALRRLEAGGMSRSAAIRSAILAAADRQRSLSALRAEVEALEADESDRAHMLEVAAFMDELRAPG